MSNYVNFVFFLHFIFVVSSFESVENTGCIINEKNTIKEIDLVNKSFVCYTHQPAESTSISRIILAVNDTDETSISTTANVTIEEYKSNEKEVTRNETWTIKSNETMKRSYFSQNEWIKITFITTGNWTQSRVFLGYEEMQHKNFVKNSSQLNRKEVSPSDLMSQDDFDDDWNYRPNSEYTFYIDKNESMSISNIEITIKDLDFDAGAGEYLLIGAGFEGSTPYCITEGGKNKKYEVDDDRAYIRFVAKATRRNCRGFNISWNYKGTTIEKPKIESKEDERKSAPICIYNLTAANYEIQTKRPGGHFEIFREKFAEVATNYTRNRTEGFYQINASSVSIFRISKQLYKDSESHLARYSMVKITDDFIKGKAAFDRDELEEIILEYSKLEIQDPFEFRKCGPRYVPESWFYFGLILLIPVVLFALLLWIWKQNPIAEHYEKKRKLKRASQHEHSKYYEDSCESAVQSTTGNPYTTLPKVQLTNEQGRRATLNFSDTLLCNDNGSDDELFNKMYANKQRRSDVLELQRIIRTNRLFLNNEGEDNAAFELDEDNNAAMVQRQHEDRAEHTYESVRSSASLCENTKL